MLHNSTITVIPLPKMCNMHTIKQKYNALMYASKAATSSEQVLEWASKRIVLITGVHVKVKLEEVRVQLVRKPRDLLDFAKQTTDTATTMRHSIKSILTP